MEKAIGKASAFNIRLSIPGFVLFALLPVGKGLEVSDCAGRKDRMRSQRGPFAGQERDLRLARASKCKVASNRSCVWPLALPVGLLGSYSSVTGTTYGLSSWPEGQGTPSAEKH
jgi:hypothetical protein